jgi:lysozyme
MRIRAPYLSACLLIQFTSLVSAQSIRTEDSWHALTDDMSRGILFSAYADSLAKEQANNPSAFVFPYTFHFSRDAIYDTDGMQRENTTFGLDVSHYQGTNIPFLALRDQHVSFIYLKATQGTTYKDDTFAPNSKVLSNLKAQEQIPYGAYHFLSSDGSQSGEDQADSFVTYVNLHGGFREGNLRPAVDLEWDRACKTCQDRWDNRSSQELISTTRAFVNRVKATTGLDSYDLHEQELSEWS